MTTVYYCLLFYYVFLLLFLLCLILVFLFQDKDKEVMQATPVPFVSILLAVRNEEQNILPCLEALANLDYPSDRMEVLIGDDLSDDKTASLVSDFISERSNFRLFFIRENMGLARAKGNVLAHLAKKATGDFFYITDADVRVPRSWVKGMQAACTADTAIVSGAAFIPGLSASAKFQCIDWVTAFGMIRTAVIAGIPVTAVGNNMMVRKVAYEATGGFENIPFSVTEDLDLHEAVRKLGWKNRNLLNHDILSTTRPIIGFINVLQQRKRWMSGAVRLPWLLVVLLSVQAMFFPVLLTGLVLFPALSLMAWAIKLLLQNIFLFLVLRRIDKPATLLWEAIAYEIYSGVCSFVLVLYYFLPLKTVWKGRKYA